MEIKDIQKALDLKTEKQAKEEYEIAIKKCHEILSPIFKGYDKSFNDTLKELFCIGAYGFQYNSKTPQQYIDKRKEEESLKLIEKITTLAKELDEIKDIINY